MYYLGFVFGFVRDIFTGILCMLLYLCCLSSLYPCRSLSSRASRDMPAEHGVPLLHILSGIRDVSFLCVLFPFFVHVCFSLHFSLQNLQGSGFT